MLRDSEEFHMKNKNEFKASIEALNLFFVL